MAHTILPSGTDSARNAHLLNRFLPRPLISLTVDSIWETKALGAGIVIGTIIIFIVNYIRSPWRKLPSGPRRLPALGNALQLRDKSWLLSKGCKEKFGTFTY